MERILKDLEPMKVFKYFEDISVIPRGSGNEKAISDYLVNFAKERNLNVIQDDKLNIIIKKKAFKGYENVPTVIIQGHMDMVCEKDKNSNHDFLKDSLKLKIEGDFIKAEGTTLGGDDGIAVAYALALLDSNDIPHPALEVLLTTEEETGMGGATKVNGEDLSGRLLLNIDSEKEGELLVSCSGGQRNKVRLPITWEKPEAGYKPFLIKVDGLKGGHSGSEINTGRANASKLLGIVLNSIDFDFYLENIEGGSKMNAIPRFAESIVLVKEENIEKLTALQEWTNKFKKEYLNVDDGVNVEVKPCDKEVNKVFSKECTNKVITILMIIPQGVQAMSGTVKGLVQSSTNLGVVLTEEDTVLFESAVRSSIETQKEFIVDQTKAIAKLVGADIVLQDGYPAWEYKENSYLRELCINTYKDMYGEAPIVTAIHAGLECGLLSEKIQGADMISFGPSMEHVHTANERLSISSTRRTWKFLKNVLKSIK